LPAEFFFLRCFRSNSLGQSLKVDQSGCIVRSRDQRSNVPRCRTSEASYQASPGPRLAFVGKKPPGGETSVPELKEPRNSAFRARESARL
jgi:hypothetical protein